MSLAKALNELKNELGSYVVQDIAPGVCMGLWRSNASALAETGRGGALNIEYKLEFNPDGRRSYADTVRLHVPVCNETVNALSKRKPTEPVQACLSMRNTWPTPTLDIERYLEVSSAFTAKMFISQVHFTALTFVQNYYREFARALLDSSYFDATDWTAPVAIHFAKHIRG